MTIHILTHVGGNEALGYKALQAGILVFGETGAIAAPGVLWSYIGETPDGAAHAMVDATDAEWERVTPTLAEHIDRPGAPVRTVMGAVPPVVVDALSDQAVRKALESLGLSSAWDAAVMAAVNASGSKDAYIWWERATAISTLEPEWAAIVAQMDWGKLSEAELLAAARGISGVAVAEVAVA